VRNKGDFLLDPISIINRLADGGFHSGSELGAQLGVSRTAVWKSLSRLEAYGLRLETVKGKGYRLEKPIELLDKDLIAQGCCLDPSSYLLDIMPVADSTNADLLASSNSFSGYQVLLAEMQNAGRGRRGREWVSPFGQNIYMSLRFDLQGGPGALAGLSLVVGLAIVRALRECAGLPATLKWPNDVMVGHEKIAGVLVELQGEPTTAWTVVVGLGLNYDMQSKAAESIDQPWTSVLQHADVGRNALCSSLLACVMEDLDDFKRKGFASFQPRWEQVDYFGDQLIEVLGRDLRGYSRGVDREGNLLLESAGQIVPVNAGEVSVRKSGA